VKITAKAAVLWALLASVSACGSDQAPVPAKTATAGPAFALQLAEVPQWTAVSAEVATVDEAQVLARIPGILSSLAVKEGDYVKKGQVIGRVVDSQLGYQSAALKAQAVQAKAEFDRTKFLYDNGVYSKARLEAAQAAADAAQAQVSAVNAVAGQGAVVAPASGRVLMAQIPAGAPVAPGMTIATITAGPVVLKLDLPESLAKDVHSGSAVMATGIGQDGEAKGTVVHVYPSVVAGTVRADAEVPGLDSSLIGRRVAAQVESGRRQALLVPQSYVTTRFGIDYVTVRGKGGTTAVPVQVTPSNEPGKVEILSGVSAGDTLVPGAGK
jgi:RND family efflux transporter MFP subunit